MATQGDPDAPVNRGLNCIKGYFLSKIMYGKDRLTTPLMRKKNGQYDKNGDFVPVSWDEAFDLMAAKWKQALKSDGPGAVGMFGSGQWTIPEGYAANKFVKGGLGHNNIDPNARLCMASALRLRLSPWSRMTSPPGVSSRHLQIARSTVQGFTFCTEQSLSTTETGRKCWPGLRRSHSQAASRANRLRLPPSLGAQGRGYGLHPHGSMAGPVSPNTLANQSVRLAQAPRTPSGSRIMPWAEAAGAKATSARAKPSATTLTFFIPKLLPTAKNIS